MSNLQLSNPATFEQRVAALELALSGALIAPPTATIASQGGAAGNYSYVVVAKYPPFLAPSAAVSTTTGPTNLTAAAFNTISWTPTATIGVGGLTPVYDVYRTAGGATQGKIASNISAVTAQGNPVALQVIDNGLVADGSTAPAFTTSGTLQASTQELVQNLAASGAVVLASGVVLLSGAGVVAATLALPGAGVQDGCSITFICTSAHAHTITTPANGINGADHIVTFTAAVGNFITLTAFGGIWYPTGNLNGTLS